MLWLWLWCGCGAAWCSVAQRGAQQPQPALAPPGGAFSLQVTPALAPAGPSPQADRDILEHVEYDFGDHAMMDALRPSIEEVLPIQLQARCAVL